MQLTPIIEKEPVEQSIPRPPSDDLLKLREAIGQSGGTGLQDQWRLYLVHVQVLHGWNLPKTWPRHNPLGPEFLAAPGADDQIGLPRNHLIDRHHAILCCTLTCTISEDVDAACDRDELRDPSNPGDQRIIPLLEEHPRPLR